MSKVFEEKVNSPKVFISYSYDNEQHEQWVADLTNNLRKKAGVNAVIDKFVLDKIGDLDEIMVGGFQDSDKVVIIGTLNYAKKAKIGEGGASYESKLATILSRNEDENKLIFVKREKSPKFNDVFPFQFKDYHAIDMSDDDQYDQKFTELYHKIYNKSLIDVEEIGVNPFDKSNPVSTEFPISSETIFSIIEKSGFEPYNVNKNDFDNHTIIIWPVVPRQNVNLIHYSQIEVIRVLSLLGFNIHVIIANCGQSEIVPNKLDLDFKEKLERCFKKKEIIKYTIEFLNTYFSNEYEHGSDILSNFVKLSSSLNIDQLKHFNTKDDTYDNNAKLDVTARNTLKFISPLLTWSAAIFEADTFFKNNSKSKALIIAGKDEVSQWSHVISEVNSQIGAIFIPILKQEDLSTIYQEKKPLIFSKIQLKSELGKGNIDRWLFQSFTNLAHFPKIVQSLPFCRTKDSRCENITENDKCLNCLFKNATDVFSDNVDKHRFVEHIYPRIEI
jgi:hypothetical protein